MCSKAERVVTSVEDNKVALEEDVAVDLQTARLTSLEATEASYKCMLALDSSRDSLKQEDVLG